MKDQQLPVAFLGVDGVNAAELIGELEGDCFHGLFSLKLSDAHIDRSGSCYRVASQSQRLVD